MGSNNNLLYDDKEIIIIHSNNDSDKPIKIVYETNCNKKPSTNDLISIISKIQCKSKI